MVKRTVVVEKVVLESELSYKGIAVLHYKIEYPQFSGIYFQRMLSELNMLYKARALTYQQACMQQLFYDASAQYDEAQANDYPFHMFEAYVTFEVTYNTDCTLSLYFDRYEFRGGAHGGTTRYSDTWNLQRECCMLLCDYFASSTNYKAYSIQTINNQIAAQVKSESGSYFDDYEKLVARYFNPRSFYLTMEGVVIYYQQYEIAPYASGIPVFTLPYENGCVIRPRCWQFG